MRKVKDSNMKNVIPNVMVFSALVGALTFSVYSQAAPTPATPPSAAQASTADAAPALTADEVVNKHLAAIGGKEAISKVKSMSMEMSVQVMGNDAPGNIVVVDGVGYKNEMEFNGTKIVQCYTDKGGWSVNPMTGSDPSPMDDDAYKAGKEQIYVGGPLYDYAAKGSKLELVSKDAGAYKIKLTTKDNVEMVFVIDPTTFYIKSLTAKTKMQGQEMDATRTFSDFRKTDAGFVVPYAIGLDLGGQFSLNIAVKKVELNKSVDPAIFEMPKPSASAAPAADKPASAPQ